MDQRSRFQNKNCLQPFVPLTQFVQYKVKDSFEYSSTQTQTFLRLRDWPNKRFNHKLLGDSKLVRTLAGCLKMQEVITMQDLRLPKFDKNRRINQQKVLVYDNGNVKYSIILGINFLTKIGIKLNYSEGNMELFDCSIPLHPLGGLNSKEFDSMEHTFHIQVEDELFGEDWLKCVATEILDAKYEQTDVVEVVKGLTHLNAHQKADLL
jgi:hypothetical protein